jgi:hypothetical protein
MHPEFVNHNKANEIAQVIWSSGTRWGSTRAEKDPTLKNGSDEGGIPIDTCRRTVLLVTTGDVEHGRVGRRVSWRWRPTAGARRSVDGGDRRGTAGARRVRRWWPPAR